MTEQQPDTATVGEWQRRVSLSPLVAADPPTLAGVVAETVRQWEATAHAAGHTPVSVTSIEMRQLEVAAAAHDIDPAVLGPQRMLDLTVTGRVLIGAGGRRA